MMSLLSLRPSGEAGFVPMRRRYAAIAVADPRVEAVARASGPSDTFGPTKSISVTPGTEETVKIGF